MFEHFYKDSFLSDYDLYLIPEDVDEPLDGEMPDSRMGPIPVHGVMLAAHSQHFTVKLQGPLGVPVQKVHGRKRLFIKVGAGRAVNVAASCH